MTKKWKFLSWQTLFSTSFTILLFSIIWIATRGVPLLGLPNKEKVISIVINQVNDKKQRTITDPDGIDLLVNAANLCSYRPFTKAKGKPTISVTYFLADGTKINLQANKNTMWWHGSAHRLHQTEIFIAILDGLFFQ